MCIALFIPDSVQSQKREYGVIPRQGTLGKQEYRASLKLITLTPEINDSTLHRSLDGEILLGVMKRKAGREEGDGRISSR